MTALDYSPPLPPPAGPRGSLPAAIVAWVFVIMIGIGLPVLNAVSKRFEPAAEIAKAGFVEYPGQYAVGVLRKMPEQSNEMINQLRSQVKDPDEAKIAVQLVERALKPNDVEAEAVTVEGDFLERNPWYAQLAAAKSSPEYQTALRKADLVFVLTVTLMIGGLFILAIGVMLGVAAIILFATGWLKMAGRRPTAPAGIYIEAFAIYLLLFLFSSLVVGVLFTKVSIGFAMVPMGLAVAIAIAWPMIRGVPGEVYRRDVGLHAGRGVLWEMGAGVIGYVACLPLLGLSLLVVLALQKLSQQTASHPIAGEVGSTSPIILLLLAAVFAPITEEIMFRGLLVSHLRAKLGILLSGLVNGLIFAAIHPQGWLAIPTLLTIAMTLTLLREWRGSLIAPITAHALNNGVVMIVIIGMSRI